MDRGFKVLKFCNVEAPTGLEFQNAKIENSYFDD